MSLIHQIAVYKIKTFKLTAVSKQIINPQWTINNKEKYYFLIFLFPLFAFILLIIA